MGSVKALLRHECSMNDHRGDSALHRILRISDCHADAVTDLLKCGVEINAVNKFGDSPLLTAVSCKCSQKIINLLLNRGAKVEISNAEGISPLHVAAVFQHNQLSDSHYNQLAVLQQLSNYVGDINLMTGKGYTALHVALGMSTGCSLKVVKLLMDKGADINIIDKKGNSALVWAIKWSHANIEVYEYLLDKGADINVMYRGLSLLHIAVSTRNSRLDIVKLLLVRGLSVNLTDNQGETPLHKALENPVCDINVIRLLIYNGAYVNVMNSSGESPLHFATKCRLLKENVIKFMIEHGALVGAKDNSGRTPIHQAIDNRCCTLRIMKLLLDQQASVNALDRWKNSLLHYAATTLNERKISFMNLLVSRNADINALNSNKESALMYLFRSTRFNRDVIKQLLDFGALINIGNECSAVSLQQIIEKCEINDTSLECIKLLIKYAFLQNNFSAEDVFEGCKNHTALSKFASDCLDEIQQLHSEKVGNLTIHELLVKQDGIYDINEILKVLDDNKYTLYKEVISSKVGKWAMVNVVKEQWIHTVKRSSQPSIAEKVIVLDYYSVCNIVKYLSELDALNFILAFHRRSIQITDSLCYSTKQNKKVKRLHNYSTKSVKRSKLF